VCLPRASQTATFEGFCTLIRPRKDRSAKHSFATARLDSMEASRRGRATGSARCGDGGTMTGAALRASHPVALVVVAALTAAAMAGCGTVSHALRPAAPSSLPTSASAQLASTLAASPTAASIAPTPTRAPRQLGPDGRPILPQSQPPGAPPLGPPQQPSGRLSPRSCGDWSASSSAAGGGITRQYGEIRTCELVGTTWVLTTEGTATSNGVIATYDCTDQACLDNANDHPLNGWHFYPAPGCCVKVVESGAAQHRVRILTGAGAYYFDLQTKMYTADSHPPR